jgi:hypothetical protein
MRLDDMPCQWRNRALGARGGGRALQERPEDRRWRQMVDNVMIDTAHNGRVFNVALAGNQGFHLFSAKPEGVDGMKLSGNPEFRPLPSSLIFCATSPLTFACAFGRNFSPSFIV